MRLAVRRAGPGFFLLSVSVSSRNTRRHANGAYDKAKEYAAFQRGSTENGYFDSQDSASRSVHMLRRG